jgi:hypothetical protein
MESAVVQISRYLDIKSVAVFSRDIDGLLMLAFQRSLYRRRVKVMRVETVPVTKCLAQVADRRWARQVENHVEVQEIVRMLSERSRSVLALRYAGYSWKEAAHLLGASLPALRSAFWREVGCVRAKLTVPRRVSANNTKLSRQHGEGFHS